MLSDFWVFVCQDVPFRAGSLAENPIDCRIFFADNPLWKTGSGAGGKTPKRPATLLSVGHRSVDRFCGLIRFQ